VTNLNLKEWISDDKENVNFISWKIQHFDKIEEYWCDLSIGNGDNSFKLSYEIDSQQDKETALLELFNLREHLLAFCDEIRTLNISESKEKEPGEHTTCDNTGG